MTNLPTIDKNAKKKFVKMQTTGERILYLIDHQGDNLTTFSKKTKIDYTSLSALTNNNRKLGATLIKRIAEYIPNLNLNWLLLGQGEVFIGKNANEDSLTNLPTLADPVGNYANIDPVEEMFLKYLDRQSVQDKIKSITNRK
ncbi:hypothetical protein [Flavobacterium rhizosphaerae]|uniref:XRE family transcriptional regulator n=1 Tax=Flavobacterium rhizosphaerae TaxID=3163298 RepID=A0ABW8YWP3_9FLAO